LPRGIVNQDETGDEGTRLMLEAEREHQRELGQSQEQP
jgi:hypothetical protein